MRGCALLRLRRCALCFVESNGGSRAKIKNQHSEIINRQSIHTALCRMMNDDF
jgi:hypothetical protein